MAKYRLNFVEATLDGSGMVAHDMWGVEDDGTIVPGRHATVLIPQADVDVVLAMPDGTPTQKQAKNAAYKDMIRANAPDGWDENDLENIVAANTAASVSADGTDEYITETLGATYPVDFQL